MLLTSDVICPSLQGYDNVVNIGSYFCTYCGLSFVSAWWIKCQSSEKTKDARNYK